MFSALRQNSKLYILDKTNGLDLKVGQVVSLSSPQYYGIQQVMDIIVNVGNERLEFKQLPANLSIDTKDNIIVSESQTEMFNEVNNIITTSEQVLNPDNIKYHEAIVAKKNEVYSILNPTYAKEKEQEDKINNLEHKVGGIENKLDTILSKLNTALGQ